MSKRLIDYDASTRTATYHDYDWMTKKTYIETVQDVKPYLERNKLLARSGINEARAKATGWKHIASIPNTVIVKLKNEYNIDVFNNDDLPKLERLLMTSEWQYLRTVDRI